MLADMYGPPHGGNYREGTRRQAKLLSLIRANTKPPVEAQAHTLGARVECRNKGGAMTTPQLIPAGMALPPTKEAVASAILRTMMSKSHKTHKL
jgi:hypothetical protein